jgi:ABC-type polysaccharide/polyol phosphate export permease
VLRFAAMLSAETRGAFRERAGARSAIALLSEAIDEVLSRRRLIRYLVAADMKKRGSDTLLGNLWWILDPLLQMVVYVFFVSVIARPTIPNYPLFIMAAILPWKWFSAAVTDATGSVVRQAGLIRQIAFPKLVLPISTATSEVIGFAWGLIPLGLLMLLDNQRITIYLLWIPVIAAVQFVFTLAVAILVSAGNVFFRDLGNVTGHLLRLWWLLSPGLYSLSQLENFAFARKYPILHDLFYLNPFATLFEAYRSVIYGTPTGGPPTAPDVAALARVLVVSIVVLMLTTLVFKRLEPEFAKVL